MAGMCRTDGSAARRARDVSGHAVRATPPVLVPPLQLLHDVRDRCGHMPKLLADLQEPACTAKLAVPEAAPGACACSRRTPHEPAGQRGEQPRISRMTAPERLRLNHCSTTPGKTGAAPALHGDE